jgi:DNA-binding MarR family transcriptional regulator
MKRKNGESKKLKPERKKLESRRCSENLRRMMTGFKSLLEHHLREEGLTLPQLRLLKAVQQQTGVSAAALARTCLVTPQTMQSILTRAVRENWIIRAKSSRNERILTASLTPLGEDVLARGLQMAARIEELIWQDVSLGDLEELNRTLDEGVARLNQLEQEANESIGSDPARQPSTIPVCLPGTSKKHKH